LTRRPHGFDTDAHHHAKTLVDRLDQPRHHSPSAVFERRGATAMSSVHTRLDFDAELRELRSRSLEMATRCERAVALAVEVMRQGDPEMAAKVRELEAQSDHDEVELTALVLRILALRQPVARDLRFLTTALKLVTDLERIGDEAALMADRATEERGEARSLLRDELELMAEHAQRILRDALKAFFEEDAESAQRALEGDRTVDQQYSAVVAKMSDRMSKRADEVVDGTLVVRIAKHLERIAGHATNVAEEAIFVITGEDIRHSRTTK
jgi:phosphate transport system protein